MIAETVMWNIYVLKNPLSQDVLYVGRTKNPKMRLSAHVSAAMKLSRANTRKNNRLRKLITTGATPVLEVVESGMGDSAEAERRWIATLRSQGIDLLNGTDGGEGVAGPRGPQSPEHIENRRTAMKAVYERPEYRARLSAAQKALHRSPEHYARVAEHLRNLGVARIGKPLSAETRARISAAQQTPVVIRKLRKRKTITIYHVDRCGRDATSRENVIRLGYGAIHPLTPRKDEEVVMFNLTPGEFDEWFAANRRMKITSQYFGHKNTCMRLALMAY